MSTEALPKIVQLEIAATIAPVLRSVSDKAKRRRVKLVDAEGNVTGESTMGEVLKGLAEDYAIEHVLKDAERPKEFTCQLCGKIRPITNGRCPKACLPGSKCRPVCACGSVVNRHAAIRAAAEGKIARCRECYRKGANSKQTSEDRAEIKRKAWATRRANADKA